jgi:hypothetical protein
MESRIVMEKQHSTRRSPFTGTFDLNLRKKQLKCYILGITWYSAETLTLRKADQK